MFPMNQVFKRIFYLLGRLKSPEFRDRVKLRPRLVYVGWGGGVAAIFQLELSRDELRAVHFKNGPIKIEYSPHYQFVQNLLGQAVSSQPIPDKWEDYISEQYHLSERELGNRREKFVKLIADYQNGAEFDVLVRCNPLTGNFDVVDGFHRLACIAAINPESRIRCLLVI